MDHAEWTIGIAHKKAHVHMHTHIHSKSCNKWKCEHTRSYERTVTICGGGGGGRRSGSVDGKCCALKHEYYFGPQLPKHILIDFMLTENAKRESRETFPQLKCQSQQNHQSKTIKHWLNQ